MHRRGGSHLTGGGAEGGPRGCVLSQQEFRYKNVRGAAFCTKYEARSAVTRSPSRSAISSARRNIFASRIPAAERSLDLLASFRVLASGYAGQTLETLQLRGEAGPTERIVGV